MTVIITLLSVAVLILLANTFLIIAGRGKKEIFLFSSKLEELERSAEKAESLTREEFARNREESLKNSREMREELGNSLRDQGATMTRVFSDLSSGQRTQFDSFSGQITALTRSNEERIDKIRTAVEEKLAALQEDNSKKLEEMRATVDEKLQSTLERRLSESFNQVSERLKQVHEGLGEMKNLATGVGDLKKVLSNVKTRGILGEIQLGNILENILSPEQYSANVATKKGSGENVEYAVKLPGENNENPVYLPIDSKFPVETYHQLMDAYEKGDPEAVRKATKDIEATIKRFAKEIREKYINPPETTDFGILFLPFEGLYAEVVRQTSLIEILQREYKIVITGPTTLAAFLNSLHMGFRTLAIQKRTGEVWSVLASVKKEFNSFGDVLEKAQNRLRQASNEIDQLVGTRTRQIQSKLRAVEETPPQPEEPAENG